MASISRLPNGMSRPRYRDEHGKEHARHFDRKVDAQRWLDQVTASVVRGDYTDPRLGRTTVQAYAYRWLEAQPLRASSRRAYTAWLRNRIVPAMGDRGLAAVTRTEVLGFRRR